MSNFRAVSLMDGPSLDAFSNLRTTTPVSLFDSSFQFDTNPLLYAQGTTSGGTLTHVPNYSSVQMNVTSTTGSQSVLMSKQYWRYQPGKSQRILLTQIFGAKVANVVKRAGYFDANDGVFFEVNGTTDIAFTLRTSTSGSASDTNRVAQSAWNLDKLDGTGASGITLDVTKANILVMDLQWLGMGRVRVGWDIDGIIVYCHQFLNANRTLSVPYMKTANLPIRWEITNNAGGASDTTMYATCASVCSEGGFETERSYTFSASNGSDVSATTSRTALLAIRPRTTFNSLSTKGSFILPNDLGVLSGTNAVLVELIYNPTLATAGSWSSVDATNSMVEVNTTMTVTAGTGIVVDSIFITGSSGSVRAVGANQLATRMPFCVDPISGTQNMFVVVATTVAATSNCRATINWIEIR